MLVQIEITTKCNLACFYCAGRLMPQRDMTIEMLSGILDTLDRPRSIQLQGEGEPLLHPQFWSMVALVKARGHKVGTLTNGTVPIDIQKLDWLSVSVDTLDVEQNKQAGRTHFDKTLANLGGWVVADRTKLRIQAVGYGQDLSSIREYCILNKIEFGVQSLSPKREYATLYPVKPKPNPTNGVRCSMVSSDFIFYNVNGERLPCCFMKFPKHTYQEIVDMFARNQAPEDCFGCRMLQPRASVKLIATDRV